MNIKDIFDLIDGFEQITGHLRGLSSDIERDQLLTGIEPKVNSFLKTYTKDELENIAIYYADKFYRIVNSISFLDEFSLIYLNHLGSAFNKYLLSSNLSIGYLVDNQIPLERMEGIKVFLNALEFVVISPELIAIELGKADGRSPEECIVNCQQYKHEAEIIVKELFEKVVSNRKNFFIFSYQYELSDYQRFANGLRETDYIGVFRNEIPVDGSNVFVFQSSGIIRDISPT